MGKIISVANQKGGVGKTTTVINLASYIAEKNKTVLVIDSDPQGNTTTGLGINKKAISKTLYTLMTKTETVDNVIIPTEVENLSIIPTDIQLSGAEIELVDEKGREFILKNIIEENALKDKYDFIIIDCPPSLNILTINALAASDSVLIPLQCEFLALEGLSQFLHTYNLIKKKMNNKIEIEGIVFTMFDGRTNLSNQVVEEVNHFVGESIYKCVIPRSIRLSEAPSYGLPISMYDRKSKGAQAYEILAEGIIRNSEV
ncbi:MAG: ParA family protein [Firmicutes bacterium]|nr:ParA family protein [Bacillota bacterium]